MSAYRNELGQPIGFPLPDWQPRAFPPRAPLDGRYCRLEPLSAGAHAQQLFAANSADRENRIWTYLPYGPFERLEDYIAWVERMAAEEDPQFYAILDKARAEAVGVASYLRIQPAVGVAEAGHINFSPLLARTPAASEAMYLMMRRIFDELGYRRFEWKCDALNAPSRRAAERLGFTYEGTFRQVTLYKGRNRDSAWFAIIDRDWPRIREAFEAWLDPANFDADGRQIEPLKARED